MIEGMRGGTWNTVKSETYLQSNNEVTSYEELIDIDKEAWGRYLL